MWNCGRGVRKSSHKVCIDLSGYQSPCTQLGMTEFIVMSSYRCLQYNTPSNSLKLLSLSSISSAQVSYTHHLTS